MRPTALRYVVIAAAGAALLGGVVYARRYTSSSEPSDLPQLSMEELEARADVQPDNHWVQMELGKRYVKSGDDEQAVRSLERCIAAAPKTSQAYYYLGMIHQRHGDFLKAVERLEKATELDPAFKDAHKELARACYSLHNYRRAMSAIEEYIRLAPKDGEGYYVQGNLYAIEGLMDKAEQSYQQSIELDSQRAASFLALGQCYLYRRPTRERLIEARRSFEKASNLEPDAADISYHLGLVHLRLGEWQEAANTLERAETLDPQYPQTHYALGQAYLRLGKNAKAQEQLTLFEQLRETLSASETSK